MYGARGRGRGQGRGRGHGRHSQAKSETQLDVVTKRLLSASRFKINELQNKQEEMRKELQTLKDENKLYKRLQHKQEKALVKFEDREAELPQLIQSHSNEVRTLREQIRRTREKYEKTDRYLRDAEDELEATKKRLKKYKNLSEEKDLAERSDLSRRLNQAELGAEEKDSKIKELERHLEMLKKNHRHELGIERARSKDLQKQLDDAKETNAKLEAHLKDKERQLDAKNIYSNRLLKPSSQGGTPAESPAPWRQNLKKKSESMTDLSPRNKAKVYEQKRKEDGKKKQLHLPKLQLKEQKTPTPRRPVARTSSRKPEPKQKWEVEDREKDTADEEVPDGPNFKFSSLKREDSEADFWRRQEERYKMDLENRDKQSADEQKRKAEEEERSMFQQQREKLERTMEERERAERERREADARENSLRERKEREDRERKEREERERREREDRERREREDRERLERERKEREHREAEQREQERKEKLDNDPKLAEEKRKKEELLRRLQQMDANRDGSGDPFAVSDNSQSKVNGDPFSSPSRGKTNKDPFLFGRGDSSESTPTSSKKDYSFTRSVENMHKGKPSHEDVSVPYIDRQKKMKASKEDAEIGGYQPSFVSPAKTTNMQQKKPLSLFDDSPTRSSAKPAADSQEKKSKLMSDLFGSHATASSTKKDDGDELFLTSSKPKQVQSKRTSGFPWDDPASAKTNGTSQRESSTLFGGGAALVDDDSAINGPKSNLLPKRTRQPAATLSSKPTVNAVDVLDDDIEEVIL